MIGAGNRSVREIFVEIYKQLSGIRKYSELINSLLKMLNVQSIDDIIPIVNDLIGYANNTS